MTRPLRSLLIMGVAIAVLASTACAADQPSSPTSSGAAPTTTQGVGTIGTATTTTEAPSPSVAQTTRPPTSGAGGPQFVYFRIAKAPSCPAGTNVAPIEGKPVVLEWKVTGVDSVELSIDGGGLYSTYKATDTASIYFVCASEPIGAFQKHTYTLTTVGGGQKRSKTVEAQARINEISQV